MRFLLVLLLGASPAWAGETAFDNAFVRVSRGVAPCARAHVPECTTRVIVALGEIGLHELHAGPPRRMLRGDVAVFGPGQSYEVPRGEAFFEVAIKADHPPARQPGERIAPEKNAIRYEEKDFLVFEEKLDPGDLRARHSHGERLVIQLNHTRLQQWPDGEPARFVETVPERPGFSPPVIHAVRNVGETPLRGIVIEFKAQ
jgi:hypothetical protein